jgi:hypothetical protein
MNTGWIVPKKMRRHIGRYANGESRFIIRESNKKLMALGLKLTAGALGTRKIAVV